MFLQTTDTFRPYVSYVVYWHLYNVCHITFTRQVATWRDVKLDPWFAMDALNVTGQTASIFLQYKVKLNFSLSWELIYVIITE